MDKIFNLIHQLKDEAEKLEPNRRNEMLDMIDAFENATTRLLDPHNDDNLADDLYKEMWGQKDETDQALEDKQRDEEREVRQAEDKLFSEHTNDKY